MSCFDDEIDE